MRWKSFNPEWALVLGSGLASLTDHMNVEDVVSYGEIDGLPQSAVPGHPGRFAFGTIHETRVVAAQGRVHLYEGFSACEVTSHVRWMHERGAKTIVLTNAAGSCNNSFAPGDWMMLADHLNLTHTSPLIGGPHFHDMTEVYSSQLRSQFAAAARELGLTIHQGVYAGMIGPQFETPAEIRMIQRLGADAVGMSTVLEAIQARALGMRVAAFSCLSNWASGLNDSALSHNEVLVTGAKAASTFIRLLDRVLSR